MRGEIVMRPQGWVVLVLLALAGTAGAAPNDRERPMPDPCVEAPSLPFCQ